MDDYSELASSIMNPRMPCSGEAFLVPVASAGLLTNVEYTLKLRQYYHGLLNNKIKSSHHFTFSQREKNVWNTRPIKTFPVADVSIGVLAAEVKCFGLQNVHYMGVFL